MKTLSPEELIGIDDHLRSCDECRDTVGLSFTAVGTADRLERALAQEHLTYENLAGYVDDKVSADSRATIAHHIDECYECALQLRELERFAGAPLVAVASSDPGWLSSLTSVFLRPVPAIASLVVVVLLGAVVWRLSSVDRTHEPAGVDVSAPVNDATVVEPTTIAPDLPSVVTPPQELAIAINDGGETVGISTSGELSGYAALRPAYRTMIKNALSSGRVNVADLRELHGTAGALMGDDTSGGTFRLTSPVGKVVLADFQTFAWQAVPGAESYVVEVFDQKFNKVASSGELKATSWKQKLERGRTYSWQVTAVADGKVFKSPQRPQPDARFRIVDGRTAADLSALKRNNQQSHLLLGVAYADAGLIEDARREFEMLSRQNPNSEVAKKLLRQILWVK